MTCGQFPMEEPDWGIFVSTFVLVRKKKKKKQEEWAQKMFEEREQTPFITEKDDLGGSAKSLYLSGNNDNDFLCK